MYDNHNLLTAISKYLLINIITISIFLMTELPEYLDLQVQPNFQQKWTKEWRERFPEQRREAAAKNI